MTTIDVDLDSLACDFGDTIDKYGHPLDVTDDEIRAALPAFLDALRAQLAARPDEPGDDAATWAPSLGEESATLAPQPGRRPRMPYMPWHRSQTVNLGATAVDEHWWQCPRGGCKVWAGPYPDPIEAKRTGMAHEVRCYRDHLAAAKNLQSGPPAGQLRSATR